MQNANEDGGGAVGFALTSGEVCRLLLAGPYVAVLEDTRPVEEFPGLTTSSEPINAFKISLKKDPV